MKNDHYLVKALVAPAERGEENIEESCHTPVHELGDGPRNPHHRHRNVGKTANTFKH